MLNYIIPISGLCLVIYLLIKWIANKYDYGLFERQGLKYVKPRPLLGSHLDMFKGLGIADRILYTYNIFPDEKIIGVYEFFMPIYVLRSPQVIKQITVKDFSYFQDRQPLIHPDVDEFFGKMLFSMQGKEWRDMRATLSPLFTGRKMRMMLQFITKCSEQMITHLQEDYKTNGLQPLPIKELFYRYTNDVIATCAFGVECDSFRNPNNEIYRLAHDLLQFQTKLKLHTFIIMRFMPKLSKLLGLEVISKDTKEKFTKLILNTMEVRKRENIIRPDMLQLLMKLRDNQETQIAEDEKDEIENERKLLNADIKHSWSDSELIAQSFVFFLAGFDNTAKVMTFAAYELAVNPDVQERLFKEIEEANNGLDGKSLSYEVLQKMKYLDAVISETLRKYPQSVATDRMCVKNYTYEDEDGLKFTIEKDCMIWIPILGLHMDPKYFPNPNKFDPDRFIDENKMNPELNSHLTFGVGPRNCIGARFTLMEIKALFFELLLKFQIKVCAETDVPLKLKKSIMGIVPDKEIKLHIEPRK